MPRKVQGESRSLCSAKAPCNLETCTETTEGARRKGSHCVLSDFGSNTYPFQNIQKGRAKYKEKEKSAQLPYTEAIAIVFRVFSSLRGS